MTTNNTGQTLSAAQSAGCQLLDMRPRQTLGQKIIAFSRSKPLGAISAAIIILTILAAVVAYAVPGILPNDPLDVRAHDEKYLPPSPSAWLGSDHLGRDEFSRIIVGSQISIYVGLLSVGIGVTLGTIIGIISAYAGGIVDLAIQRIVDAMMAFPPSSWRWSRPWAGRPTTSS